MSSFPVITSVISDKSLGEFVKDTYNLNEKFECKLFRTGINHTYFISDGEDKYVIRVYSYRWRSKAEIQEELQLLQLLHQNNISVSFPIADKTNNLIQEILAPEGPRFLVLFSFAAGDKVRILDVNSCFQVGSLMAKIHNYTANKTVDRVHYTVEELVKNSYGQLTVFFSESLPEMKYLKVINQVISEAINSVDQSKLSKGIVHLDIWYDNFSITSENEITIFDFDFCGNGWFLLDIAYFCKQLFFIEADKETYEQKVNSFLTGYRKTRELSDEEIALIPEAGTAVFAFYLGVQAKRFDWSNVFLTENYLKMFVGRMKSWADYCKNKEK